MIAALISYTLRVPQYTRRIVCVVYSIAFCLWATYPFEGVFKLGIDLSGGTILNYQVKQPAPPGFRLDKLVQAIQGRVNPVGMTDVTIRGVGEDRVEIIIPKAGKEDVERCKRVLTDLGTLEFRILANRRDHGTTVTAAEQTFPAPVVADGKVVARWVPVAPDSRGAFVDNYGGIAVQSDPQDPKKQLVLVVQDTYNVTGEFLRQATASFDQMAAPAVSFRFNSDGARRFAALTGENRPDSDGFERRLAIILNGHLNSAPSLRDQIHDQGIITGRFTQQEVDDLVAVLNAGSLPGELERDPISEVTVGPTLGRDTIESGLWAMAVASVMVFLFMAVYYRVAGLIADLAVILNMGIVVGVMVALKASFTLAGLAGLALTIGMAVDANVLIFERLREEQEAGKSLRTAIRNAFERAMAPILDSNITTLLTGVMLYAIGSEQVRGFALTLVLGLAANLFTAVFVCRLIFDILERNGWKKHFGMFRLLSHSHWDFMRMRFAAVTVSLLLISVGIVGVVLRGNDLFDIDFTGGTLAAVRLKEPVDPARVRALTSQALPDVSVEELNLRDEPERQHYLIRTTLADQREVRRLLGESLSQYVVVPTMTVDPFQPVSAAASPGAASPGAASPGAASPGAASPGAASPGAPDQPPAAASEPPTPGPGSTATAGDSAAGNAPTDAAAPKGLEAPSFPGGQTALVHFDVPMTLTGLRGALDEQLVKLNLIDPQRHYSLTDIVPAANPEDGAVQLRLNTDIEVATIGKALDGVRQQFGSQPVLERLDNFGSQVAGEARAMAGLALLAGMGVIVVYLWVRFQNVLFGLGAVIALVHDVLVVLGLVGLSRWLAGNLVGHMLLMDAFKIDLPMVAAFLTLVGYSVNDTIVVFDRIRESRKKYEPMSWTLLNTSVNQTLSRTVLTAFTTWLVALILYVVGGQGIHGFSFVLTAGVIVGTYSSIYIASPTLLWLAGSGVKQQQPKPRPTTDRLPNDRTATPGTPLARTSASREGNGRKRLRG